MCPRQTANRRGPAGHDVQLRSLGLRRQMGRVNKAATSRSDLQRDYRQHRASFVVARVSNSLVDDAMGVEVRSITDSSIPAAVVSG